jgi:hypothetical protein
VMAGSPFVRVGCFRMAAGIFRVHRFGLH